MEPKCKVLIVDDEPAGREVLEALLFQEYDLSYASSGAEALSMAAAQTPDLILLDIMMPEMDGFEVCRRMRRQPQMAEVPIVMLTALDDSQSKLEALQAGADDFLTKPIDRLALRARVKTITRLNRYRRMFTENVAEQQPHPPAKV